MPTHQTSSSHNSQLEPVNAMSASFAANFLASVSAFGASMTCEHGEVRVRTGKHAELASRASDIPLHPRTAKNVETSCHHPLMSPLTTDLNPSQSRNAATSKKSPELSSPAAINSSVTLTCPGFPASKSCM